MKNKIRKTGSWSAWKTIRKQHDREIIYVKIAAAITVFVTAYILQF
ncbi:hypothetical protein [Chryseobacterium sp. Leaf180]|nr:hypothetical protein [Chryseobacterium sp. Leaf180]